MSILVMRSQPLMKMKGVESALLLLYYSGNATTAHMIYYFKYAL